MKKIIIGLIIVVLFGIFFFFKIIPQSFLPYLPMTPEQDAFCKQHGCGLIIDLTPYEFLKQYINRLN